VISEERILSELEKKLSNIAYSKDEIQIKLDKLETQIKNGDDAVRVEVDQLFGKSYEAMGQIIKNIQVISEKTFKTNIEVVMKEA
jgi:hypothetical protein